MDYIRFAISYPVRVTVGVLLLVLFGLLSVFAIPIQLVPDVDRPIITVETEWTGRSPEEVEQEIVEEQEDKLKAVSNLKKMTAQARQGRGQITLEFYIGTNIDRALQEVSDKLREVPDYPRDVEEPVIRAADTASENAIAWIILDSTDPGYDIQGFFDVADKRIKPTFERVAGVSQVNIYGGRERQVQIRIDPDQLARKGVTYVDLIRALEQENVNVSAGDLPEGRLDVRVRTVGQYDRLEEVLETVVKTTAGGPVRVRDIGDVALTLEKRRTFVRSNGKPALAINAIRETGANVIQVMADLKERIAEVNRDILPLYGHGLHLRQVYDETVYINDAIGLVLNNLWIGGSMAVVVLLLFLRTIRPTVIIALAIPVSVVGTFVVMTGFGRNLNVISLAGLAFAVGMVIDNAIVVLENIDRHLAMGKSPAVAAYDGTKEVWGAILASTLTTLAVFVPVLTVEEEAGQLFRDIALAVCASVSLSLLVSVTVIPSASSRWLKPVGARSGFAGRLKGLFGLTRLLDAATRLYADFIHWLVSRGAARVVIRIMIVGAFTVVAVGGVVILKPPTSYLPQGNKNLIFGIMLTPPAYTTDHNETIGHRVEAGVAPYWQADTSQQATAVGPVIRFETGQPYPVVPAIDNFFFVSWEGTIFMGCSSKDKELVRPLGSVLGQAMSGIPGSFGFAQQASLFGRGVGGSNAIDVELSGFDLPRLRGAADALYMALTGEFGFRNVRPDPLNFNLSGPEIQVRIDQVRAKDLGLDVAAIGRAVQTLVDGTIIGDYRLEGESVDLVLTRHPGDPITPDRLEKVPLAVRLDDQNITTVPLSAVADVGRAFAPQQINRIEQVRSIKLTVIPDENTPLEVASDAALQMAQDLKAQGKIGSDIAVNLAGTADQLTQVRQAMLGRWLGWTGQTAINILRSRFFLALLITYLLMAALFESFVHPLGIMFTVPLAAVGGVLGLAAMHAFVPSQHLDVLTMLGFVILIGIVVNNAILIVHQALNFMRGGGEVGSPAGSLTSNQVDGAKLAAPEAIRESVRTRVRPICMTTLTSVFGMLPLVLMPGSGSELYKGLGSVVLGGLTVSTIFSLLVVPLVFSLILEAKTAASGRLGWAVPDSAQAS